MIPNKIRESIIEEAIKNVEFSWYSGWEKSSGYIKSRLNKSGTAESFRIYIKWERKKEPTPVNIRTHITDYLDQLLKGNEHNSILRDFRHYIQSCYWPDVKRLQKEIICSIDSKIEDVLIALKNSQNFEEPKIQELYNDILNYKCVKEEYESVEFWTTSIAEKMHNRE